MKTTLQTVEVRQFLDCDYMNGVCKRDDVWLSMIGNDEEKRKSFTMKTACDNPKHIFMLVLVDGVKAGFLSFLNNGFGVYDWHIALPKPYRGAIAVEAVRKCFDWMFVHTDATLILGICPVATEQVFLFDLMCGCKFAGRVPLCWEKNGKVGDARLTFFTREMWKPGGNN